MLKKDPAATSHAQNELPSDELLAVILNIWGKSLLRQI